MLFLLIEDFAINLIFIFCRILLTIILSGIIVFILYTCLVILEIIIEVIDDFLLEIFQIEIINKLKQLFFS